uniref:hypothetical protein n=1 Tax=Pontibacter fetidus TaxID=2700082 RepID=UPI001F2A5B2D|nr:hypothetical protein [Pontibacter fetidus]
MTEQTITIYCFIDDFFHAIGRKEDAHCKINDAEVLTTALLSARYFYGNLHSAYGYMQAHHGVRRIDKSGFIRRLHALKEQLLALFSALAQSIKQLNTSCSYLMILSRWLCARTSASSVLICSNLLSTGGCV